MNRIEMFLKRIGLAGEKVRLDVGFLGKVQSACVQTIAYENLDILMGKPLSLAPEDIFEKIVVNGRGGYCFELNGLLADMLSEMGFIVSERFARFLRGEETVPMRRHRVAVVTLEGGAWLVDIGVGQNAPRLPMKLSEDLPYVQAGETYVYRRHPVHGNLICDLHNGALREYIAFSDDIAYPVDFLQPTFYCEKHPDSIFNKEPIVAIKTPGGRKSISGRTYKVFEGDALAHIEEDVAPDRLRQLLKEEFFIQNAGY